MTPFADEKCAFNLVRLAAKLRRLRQLFWGSHLDTEHDSSREKLHLTALRQIQSSIRLLDQVNAPGHIAAHLDLAMHQLEDVIENEFASARLVQIDRKAAPQ
jgi:hypothetical protein